MKYSARALLPLAVLFAAACRDGASVSAPLETLAEPAVAAARGGEVIPDHYIVVFNDAVRDVGGLARQLAEANGGTVGFVYQTALRGFSVTLSPAAAEAVARNPNVTLVEPDQVITADGTQTGATWGLDRIDQRSLPTNGSYTYNNDGAGITAYIIDTGIRLTHSEIVGRATSGFDAVDGGAADDCHGHGTHVSGTVGGATYGVAKGVSLVAVRVLDCQGNGTTSGVIAGIDWVTANKVAGKSVANMSLGGGASSSLDQAVVNSIAAGVTYAIAAGNGDILGRQLDACTQSPARVAAAITIGATNSSDAKASWSNYGNCVDFFAPGVNITSAWKDSDTQLNTISGTSMATPHVTGAAALYLAANPGSTPQQDRDGLHALTTKGIVTSSSTANNHLLYTLDIGPAAGGGGGGGGGTTNQAPVAGFTASCTNLSCTFTNTSTDDAGIASSAWTFGDGGTSSATSPTHAYANGGTYTVGLTVTDAGGLSNSTSQSVTVSAPAPSGIVLSGSGSKTKGTSSISLSWTGGTAPFDVYRNGVKAATTSNSSFAESFKGGGTFTYQVCNAGTQTCSNTINITT